MTREDGKLIGDPTRFPSGIKALADYVHSIHLKFGLYTSEGNYTCQKRPATLGYETVDAETWASWGVDYVKVNCDTRHTSNMNIQTYLSTTQNLSTGGQLLQ